MSKAARMVIREADFEAIVTNLSHLSPFPVIVRVFPSYIRLYSEVINNNIYQGRRTYGIPGQ